MVWRPGRRPEAAELMRCSGIIRATPGSARNLAVVQGELGDTAGRDEALQIPQGLEKNGRR